EPLLSGKTSGWKTMMDVSNTVATQDIDSFLRIVDTESSTMLMHTSASKYAVTALTEGLRQELREAKTHIRATCISPGLVETEFAYRLFSENPEKAAATYKSIKCLQAADIANAVVYVLSAPDHVQIGDIQMRPVEQLT
uniref:Dehydrogenase/reductase (SDR family) member 11b n=1 Tax=Sinocyclocheilus rhinocerous TaxID=307959 RepID=A0A673L4G2_9TELE